MSTKVPVSELAESLATELLALVRRQQAEIARLERECETRAGQLDDALDSVAERDATIRELQEMALRQAG